MTQPSFLCRACGSADVSELLDLGSLPLANAFVSSPADTADQFRERLVLVMCRPCSMIQLRDEVSPEHLFHSYLWVTSTSAGAAKHAVWLADWLARRYGPAAGQFLVEIASNDGFFLKHYRSAGFAILGIDPSNLALEADQAGLPSLREFFSEAVARRVLGTRGAADVIVARNVLGHVNRPADFARGVKALLASHGRFVLEVPYALMLRDETQYDTIFHEHVSYPIVRSVEKLMRSVEMKITDIGFVQMNGGSMLCEIRHAHTAAPDAARPLLDLEAMMQLDVPEGWRSFATAVTQQRELLQGLLVRLRASGRKVVGYGAAAKCMTMLNYCGIGPDLLSAMGDANPRKQGLLCPGVRIPVVSPQALLELEPDVILIGAWNFRTEIVRQFRDQGYRGEFVLPLPIPAVVRD